MHRLVKAMTVAGMVTMGLPLLPEAASAQTINTWYQFSPNSCEATISPGADGSTSTTMYVGVFLNGTYTYIYMPDSQLISAMYKSCTDGSGFLAWYAGPAAGWTSFYTYPGLR
jgi:hypothetical protein